MERKWYSGSFRRHLCDMHIDGWDERFLSEFSPEEYAANLRTAKIDAPMLYFQSHAGWCYFPTKADCVHPAFRREPDRMRRLVELCHESGMSVVGYYSLNYNTWAHDTHPEWRMLEANGRSARENRPFRYGFCCPNNREYRAFVYEQIREMLEYFEVEGMFYDMPFWPHVCYCPDCRRRWAEEVGGDMPASSDDPMYEKLLERMRFWMGEWAQAVTDCTKALCPGVSVEHNFANAVAGGAELAIGDAVNEACDYTGGDLYGGLYQQSFTCKYYWSATRNQPFEYMTTRAFNLGKHTLTKTQRELETAVMLTCAHHGASLLIDAIDPVGTLDGRIYRMMGEVFGREIPYEPYLTGRLAADVGVMYDLPSKIMRNGQRFGNHEAALQAVTDLVKRHVPVGVVTYRQMDSLPQYPALIAPCLHSLSEEAVGALVGYVQQGGRLYFSGAEQPELIKALLGAEVSGYTGHTAVYLAPTEENETLMAGFSRKYPLPFDGAAPILSGLAEDAQVLAYVELPYTLQKTGDFASIHSNPPGVPTDFPALVRRRVGRGEVIWCGVPIEMNAEPVYGGIMMNLLGSMGLEPRLTTTASRTVETTVFSCDGCMRISAVRLSSEYEGALPTFTVQVKTDRRPERVLLLPQESEVPFDYVGGWTSFMARELDLFDMYEIRL